MYFIESLILILKKNSLSFIIRILIIIFIPYLYNFFLLKNDNKILFSTIYPNASITSGETFPNVNNKDICTSNYTKLVRDVSLGLKKKVYAEYGVTFPQKRGAYEVDHFIPLEIGGSNDIKNLWLEAAEPIPGFNEKDVVENYLHAQICQNRMSILEAQDLITKDWYKIYENLTSKEIENYRFKA